MSSPLTPTKFSAADYTDVGGILTYLDNVGGLLAEILSMADLTGIEVQGPATELEKFKKISTSIRRGSRSRKASPSD